MESPLIKQQDIQSGLSANTFFNVAKTYQQIGRFNQSLAVAYSATQKDSDLQKQYQAHYIETIKLGAEFAEEIGNHHLAAHYWEHLIKYQAKNSDAWHGLGIAKANLKDFSAAQQALAKCLQIQPNNHKVRNQLQEIQQLVSR